MSRPSPPLSYWDFDKIKTVRGCDSYFVGDCDLKYLHLATNLALRGAKGEVLNISELRNPELQCSKQKRRTAGIVRATEQD